jgi:mannose-6-phosphate isomerase-like protein (cupin superfamily)
MAEQIPPQVVNADEIAESERFSGEHYGALYKQLTPSMRPRGGTLGVNHMRVPRGRSVCPFHAHLREDEVFFVLSGRGVLRYGEELVYLSIGPRDPHEVCTYPDSGKVFVRGVDMLGEITPREYYDGEPDPPRISELSRGRTTDSR